jgi:hypothetical protein
MSDYHQEAIESKEIERDNSKCYFDAHFTSLERHCNILQKMGMSRIEAFNHTVYFSDSTKALKTSKRKFHAMTNQCELLLGLEGI